MKLTEEQIKFLDKVCQGNQWNLTPDGKVDVDGGVFMNNMDLTEVPVKFGSVSGYFECTNNQLTSLEFCPSKVGGDFRCFNNILTSLEFAPKEVGGSFNCSNNQLTSLEFCPSKVGEVFYCSNNQLTDYFKSIKEEDFPHWDKLFWVSIFKEYPFLVNIGKKYIKGLKYCLNKFPLTKLYLE